jgi:outer membrane murein-binding lipoprotein Lpp
VAENIKSKITKTGKPVDLDIDKLANLLKDERDRVDALVKLPSNENTIHLMIKGHLSEMQNADQLVENHSRVSLVVSIALLGFAISEFATSIPVWQIAALGIVVCVVWCLKIFRHKQIFDYCRGQLKKVYKVQFRCDPAPPCIHGFGLMYALVIVLLIAWVGLIVKDYLTPWRTDVVTLQEKIGNVETRTAQAVGQVVVAQESVNRLNQEVGSAKDRLDSVETNLQEVNSKIEKLGEGRSRKSFGQDSQQNGSGR